MPKHKRHKIQDVILGSSTIKEAWENKNPAPYLAGSKKGVDEDLVRFISKEKNEPQWMLEHRLASLKLFYIIPLPQWGPDLRKLNLEQITYYAKAVDRQSQDWKDVPQDIKKTFDRLGIPEAEQKVLAGVGAQYESTVIYHNLKKQFRDQGVIFEDLDVALHEYPDLVKQYFMKCVSPALHKFAALHGAVWSGGTFLYIPKGVKVDMPLQAYFRMNAAGMGQFEHTLIIIEESGVGHYIEGCSAPRYGVDSLHAGCVEVFVKDNAHFRYSSIESWSKDAYNLNTKRAIVGRDAHMEWVGGNFGSAITMLYPCSVLAGIGASADHLGLAFANKGQKQDTGAKVIHIASNTSSKIQMKSISKNGGISIYRGLLDVRSGAENVVSNINCDALILDDISQSQTVPEMKIANQSATVAHEASAGKINEDDIFYLCSPGLAPEEAATMIVNGFINPIAKELPLEYALEMNRMIELEMEGSVG